MANKHQDVNTVPFNNYTTNYGAYSSQKWLISPKVTPVLKDQMLEIKCSNGRDFFNWEFFHLQKLAYYVSLLSSNHGFIFVIGNNLTNHLSVVAYFWYLQPVIFRLSSFVVVEHVLQRVKMAAILSLCLLKITHLLSTFDSFNDCHCFPSPVPM